MDEQRDVKKESSLKKNFILNAILTISGFLFPLISFPYVSRVLHPHGTGLVQTATSFVAYFSMIAGLGIPTYGIRVCAKVRDDKEKLSKTAQELFIINAVMSVISYAVLAGCIAFIPKIHREKELYIVTSLVIFFNLVGMEWLYKALEKYRYITIRSIIFKFIALVSMFILIHKESDYVIYGGITIFAASASGVLNFLNVKKYISFKKTCKYEFRPHFKAVAVFFAMSCATTIYTNLDAVMLGFMKGETEVGYYNASVKIKQILVGIVTSLGAVLLPRASYYVEHKMMDEFRRISKKAINFVVLFATPLMIYFMTFAPEGIYFLSGAEYRNAIVPMIIIMPTLLLIGLTNILGIEILVPLGRERVVLHSVIAGAVTDVILNVLLIPGFKSSGAAIGTLAAEVVVLIYQYIALRSEVSDIFKKLSYFKILPALFIAELSSIFVIFLPLGYSERDCFIKIVLSGVIFFGVYGLFLYIAKEQMVREILDSVLKKLKKKNG
ncbi:MAG: flippase [Eubacterium sp.]|nr:flippase [Eubacterium sp.]